MRIALISDIHGNLPAFEAVMKELKRSAADTTVFLGDLVSSGLYPSECLSLLMTITPLIAVKGNADYLKDPVPESEKLGAERFGRLEIVNPGAVGFSFDGDTRAGFGVLTVGKNGVRYEQKNVEYPVERYAGEMLKSDFPFGDDYASQLETGESNRKYVCPRPITR